MKNLVNLISICFLLAFTSSMSIAHAQRFSFGVSAGIINSQFDGDKLIGFKKTGPMAGLNWYYNINEANQLEFDFDYLNIGSRYAGETRPSGLYREEITLLEIDMHAVSFFTGYVIKLDPNSAGVHSFKLIVGPRITKPFLLNMRNLSFGRERISFSDNSLNTTLIGPEIKIAFTFTQKLSLNLIAMVSATNMISEKEHNVEILRPFYYGITSSYHFGDPNQKLKRKSKKRGRRK